MRARLLFGSTFYLIKISSLNLSAFSSLECQQFFWYFIQRVLIYNLKLFRFIFVPKEI